MKARLLLGWLLAMGCSGTEATDIVPAATPGGWIYFSTSYTYGPPARVNAATGQIESIILPPPFEAMPSYLLASGFVSPRDGDLAGRAKLGSLFPETFVLDAATGDVTIYAESASPYTISVDAGHLWAPDGSAVVFERHQTSGCCSVWVLLHPATGRLDTLERVAERVPITFAWFGPDTLISVRFGNHYRALALATGDTSVWNVVPYTYSPLMPTASLDRQWIAHWSRLDSTVAEEGTVQFIQLRLRDRRLGTDTLLLTARNLDGPTLPSESFDPDSRFLAYCTSFTNIRIIELATGRAVKDLTVPFCYALSWSWGAEGRPAT